ncbi:hypothetical protein C8R44DRAFT_766321 [Mycena epipterygia]|nr:hypothetical protein C8R44DRAFT_766321 [Mycena epipterygia]
MSILKPAIIPSEAQQPLRQAIANQSVDVFHPMVLGNLPMLQFSVFKTNGFPLGVVLDACCAVACNKQGELYQKDSPDTLVASCTDESDMMLPSGSYIFKLIHGAATTSYPLYASFAVWKPPTLVPVRWQGDVVSAPPLHSGASDASTAVKVDDEACIMTGAVTGTNASYMVPRSEAKWFQSHYSTLKIWGADTAHDLNAPCNLVTLRSDLSLPGTDAGIFLFAPYAGGVVAVFPRNRGGDLAEKHHLQRVRLSDRVRRGYLYIQFVWNIFNFSAPGLSTAAAAIQQHLQPPSAKRPPTRDGGLNRDPKRPKSDTSNDGSGGGSQKHAGGSGSHKYVGDDSQRDSSLSTVEDGENAPQTEDVPMYDAKDAMLKDDACETLLLAYDAQDAMLKARGGSLTVHDIQAGRYPGFSKARRLAHDYVQRNPHVSAVANTHVWEGDSDE